MTGQQRPWLTIDGSQGEGGGQILRTGMALSLLTGYGLQLVNIRARRERPGLRAEHLAAIEAAAMIGQARVAGAELGSMQLTARHKVATPVNWKKGDDVIILPAVSDEEARQKFPNGWRAPRPYLRIVPQPD